MDETAETVEPRDDLEESCGVDGSNGSELELAEEKPPREETLPV